MSDEVLERLEYSLISGILKSETCAESAWISGDVTLAEEDVE